MTWLDDLQRRLAVAGARSLRQQFAGQFGRAVRGRGEDVWETATTEPVDASAGNAPECAWCPICRAIRMARDSNPDMASRVGETASALMSAAHDVVAAVDAALSRMPGSQESSPPTRGARAEPAARSAGSGERRSPTASRPPTTGDEPGGPAGPAAPESAAPAREDPPPDAAPSADGHQA